jgi:hypothetical protein
MRYREPAFLKGREDETFSQHKSFMSIQDFFAQLPEIGSEQQNFTKSSSEEQG